MTTTNDIALGSVNGDTKSKLRARIKLDAERAIQALKLEQKGLTEADALKVKKFAWLMAQCQPAMDDVEYFWTHQPQYSFDPKPQSLQAEVFLFSGRSSKLVFCS